MNLDDVGALFHLATNNTHHFIFVAHDFGITSNTRIGDQFSGSAADCGHQCEAAGAHGWAFDDASIDRIAECRPNVENAINIEHRSNACLQHFSYVEGGKHCRCGWITVHEEFVVGARLAKRDVNMRINEPWHYCEARSINCLCIGTIGSVDCEIFADCNNAITF